MCWGGIRIGKHQGIFLFGCRKWFFSLHFQRDILFGCGWRERIFTSCFHDCVKGCVNFEKGVLLLLRYQVSGSGTQGISIYIKI